MKMYFSMKLILWTSAPGIGYWDSAWLTWRCAHTGFPFPGVLASSEPVPVLNFSHPDCVVCIEHPDCWRTAVKLLDLVCFDSLCSLLCAVLFFFFFFLMKFLLCAVTLSWKPHGWDNLKRAVVIEAASGKTDLRFTEEGGSLSLHKNEMIPCCCQWFFVIVVFLTLFKQDLSNFAWL